MCAYFRNDTSSISWYPFHIIHTARRDLFWTSSKAARSVHIRFWNFDKIASITTALFTCFILRFN